jgi:hypothetical protein
MALFFGEISVEALASRGKKKLIKTKAKTLINLFNK